MDVSRGRKGAVAPTVAKSSLWMGVVGLVGVVEAMAVRNWW